MKPEEQARRQIDELLAAAGWVVQDRADLNLGAGPGVAVREYPLATGFADYLLFAGRKAVGVVEAKPAGVPLGGIGHQSQKYGGGLPPNLPAWRNPLPFLYESTGVETHFTDGRDPDPRSRRVFAFHTPQTLATWAQEEASLRHRLGALPPLNATGLWPAQAEAIRNLEISLADNRPRALVQMATGSGKTFTAINAVYRLVKYAGVRRVLFLVDRGNLGRQTFKEFQQFSTPDDGRKFTLRRYRASVLKAACEGSLVPTEAALAQAEGRTYEPASALLQRVLAERRARWQADHPGKTYKEPAGPDTDALPELPEGWCWATVEQLMAEPMMNGHSVPSADTGFPVLRLTAIRDGRIDLNARKTGDWDAKQAKPYLVRQGDFFVSRGNGSIRLVGRAGLVDLEPDQVAFPDTMIRLAPNEAIYPRYLRLAWDSPQMRRQIEGSAKTTAGIHKISQQDIGHYVVPLPPAQEQKAIVNEAESRLSEVMALGTTLSIAEQRAARLRQSILQRAFSGELTGETPASATGV